MTWPLCECGCGEPVAVDRRSGRPARYAGHRHSQRRAMDEQRKAQGRLGKRRCMTCKKLRSTTSFDGYTGRRCNECKHRMALATCVICGAPSGEAHGQPRKICDKSECRRELASRQRKVVTAKILKKTAARKIKVCPACAKRKPLTKEFWSTSGKRSDGLVRWDVYCRSCRVAINGQRRKDPRQKALMDASARRSRERLMARRAADPVFDAEYRAKHREWERRSRERAKQPQRTPILVPTVPPAGGAHIPAGPLLEFIDRKAQQAQKQMNGHAPDMNKTLERVCMKLGVASRSVREWRDGSRQSVLADVADRVMVNAGVLWFDVYDPDVWPAEHAIAAQAFA